MRPKRKSVLFFIAVIALMAAYANVKVIGYESQTTDDISALPVVKACLVLGTSKFLSGGELNQFYSYRISAAKLAYRSGKCSKIIVSGDNRKNNYNEPAQMKQSLAEQGIPLADIHCDYAGGRTLDSVIRFKYVFGQSSGIVISQQFHNARAVYIGQSNGINLVGFNAQDADAYNGFRTKVREIFSRIRAVVDIELLHSEPRHYGDPVHI